MEAIYWFVAALGVASLFFLAVGRWLHGKETGPASRLVVFVSYLQGVLCLLAIGQTVSPSRAVAELVYLVAGVGFLLIPLAWFLFAIAYAYPERYTRRLKLAVGGYFLLVAGLILTNPLHGRYASEVRYVAEPFPHVQSVPTPLGLLTYVSYLLFLTGVVALAHRLLTTLRASRGQIAALLVGLLFPAAYVPVVLLGVLPGTGQGGGFTGASLGYMLVGSTWPSALIAWAVFRYQLFDVVPLARESIFEDREEPVLVLDARGRLIDYNRAAVEMFPVLEGNTGSPLSLVAPELVEAGATRSAGGADPRGVGSGGTDSGDVDSEDADTADADTADEDPGGVNSGGTSADTFADSFTRFTESGPRDYAVGVSTLSTDDEVRGYSLVLRDVTERERHLRDLERQTEQLERFASTLSHDLRNPLNVAQARVKMAIQSGSVEKLEKADEAHDRIDAMIQDLLTLAREGQTIDEVAPVRLGDVLRDAWETTDTREVTLEAEPEADVVVYADAGRLQNVFENLIRNGVEHGGDGVTVTLGRHAEGFYVEDDGPGVPEDDRSEVFEFGYTTARGGTGLGLAIVESIARAHGWSVEMAEGSQGGARIVFSGVDVVESQEGRDEPVAVT